MKNTIIAIFALSFMSVSHAAYKLYIPLEQPNGGSLPNGTIQIKPRSPGISAESWRVTDPLYGEWINVGGIYGCSNWGPDPSTQTIGVTFDQTATDCKQDQTTTKQEREQETTTLVYRNIGEPSIESKSVAVHSTRKVTGTKENWQAAEPLYGEWVNNGAVYGCSNWAPAPTSMLKDEPYNQTATDCKQDQSRTKQDREQETTTLEYRNVGLPVPENHTISVNSSRPSNGLASCVYNVDVINNYWYASAISNYLQVVVNGVAIKYQTNYTSTSITVNGVRYKRGALIKDNFYEVCK
ncbi:hypothetical protein [Pseudomonas sp. MF6396]|uniref:hypothetical protein n=1 Tax=Pseudomonas sp. MF6396 TaxID=1960828 RepID=UPI00129052CB|nr:hypothetical protein [Pseudomonas sp. MF6396]